MHPLMRVSLFLNWSYTYSNFTRLLPFPWQLIFTPSHRACELAYMLMAINSIKIYINFNRLVSNLSCFSLSVRLGHSYPMKHHFLQSLIKCSLASPIDPLSSYYCTYDFSHDITHHLTLLLQSFVPSIAFLANCHYLLVINFDSHTLLINLIHTLDNFTFSN